MTNNTLEKRINEVIDFYNGLIKKAKNAKQREALYEEMDEMVTRVANGEYLSRSVLQLLRLYR
ncbi:hypothetical protein [Parageobacillus thermoglucosidasius]|uniref:hypothetical protein n=1 Tax=Parageobacillus thermoglucosidasius TaxID=1426 RepID=UPI002E1BB58D|nr:hypothetical protein [Parageobacillus thermoglucosidasius]MED4946487.1 hypothetical protein [Parageobacillus thermoglucosidasius]MED4984048.1 hypothetical protein [Parageobacillus thermoglucosidasius]